MKELQERALLEKRLYIVLPVFLAVIINDCFDFRLNFGSSLSTRNIRSRCKGLLPLPRAIFTHFADPLGFTVKLAAESMGPVDTLVAFDHSASISHAVGLKVDIRKSRESKTCRAMNNCRRGAIYGQTSPFFDGIGMDMIQCLKLAVT